MRRQLKQQSPDRRLVLVSQIEHLGDLVASEPVSRYVRRMYPDAYIMWCVRRPFKDLIESNPLIDQPLIVDCLTEWVQLGKRRGLFDEVIDLHFNGRVCPTCYVPLRRSTGNVEINYDNYFNYGNLLSAYCQSAGIPVSNESPKVYLSPKHADRVDTLGLPEGFITIHCVSNDMEKDWPAGKWQELVEIVIEAWGVRVVEVGLRSPISCLVKSPLYTDLCGRLSILETAEVIRRSQFFVGIDSGPAHLANAVGTPGVILLGAFRNFSRYLPYSGGYADGSGARLIYSAGAASDIPVAEVLQVLEERLKIPSALVAI